MPADAAEGEYEIDVRDAEPDKGGIDVRLTFRVPPPEESSPPFNPQVTALQFYETGLGDVPPEQRVYAQRFARETSRYINWVLDLAYPAPGSPVNFKITAIYLRDNGTGSWEEIHRQTADAHVEGDWTWSSHWWGYGCDDPPNCWEIGSYRVDIYLEGLGTDGQLATSGQFEIYGTADTQLPTVSWVKPVANGAMYPTASGTVELEVTASDSSGIHSVEFYRYDSVSDQLVRLTTDSSAPYQASVKVDTLNMKLNGIVAVAVDTAGNRSRGNESIFIYRLNPAITLDPTEGFKSKEVTVRGSGWFPGDTVIIINQSTL